MKTPYFSYAEQAGHYFDRPHDEVARTRVDTAAAWRGPQMSASDEWRCELTQDDVDELRRAVAHARSSGKPMREMVVADFPLPTLAPRVAGWATEVHRGRGFQVVSGVPVDQWSPEDSELFFWCLGLHLGRPGAQNPQDELLGHVTDTGDSATDPFVRLYRTSANIAYHCDAADMVGLLCLHAAKSGGASRICSSVSVYNSLLSTDPGLVDRLYEPFLLDIRNEDSKGVLRYLPIPPCRFGNGRLRTFYHSDYFRSVQRHDEVPEFSEEEQSLLDRYEELASSPDLFFDMDLAPGDIQLLSNHTVLHARTEYEDHPEAEKKRHLLRLWLSVEEG